MLDVPQAFHSIKVYMRSSFHLISSLFPVQCGFNCIKRFMAVLVIVSKQKDRRLRPPRSARGSHDRFFKSWTYTKHRPDCVGHVQRWQHNIATPSYLTRTLLSVCTFLLGFPRQVNGFCISRNSALDAVRHPMFPQCQRGKAASETIAIKSSDSLRH